MTNETMIGLLTDAVVTEGAKNGKAWKRATLKLDVNGVVSQFGTFEATDIDIAVSLKGKKVQLTYVVSGQYNNVVKGGIKEDGVETIGVNTSQPAPAGPTPGTPAPSTKTPESMKKVADYQSRYESAEERELKQARIVKQSCDKLVLGYFELCIRAVECGIVPKTEVSKEDLNFANLTALSDGRAKQILAKSKVEEKDEEKDGKKEGN